jgi:hypothetical protein
MKYLKLYDPAWDEVYQVAMEDDDPALLKLPLRLISDLSDTPHTHPHGNPPVRPRSKSEADAQRQAELGDRRKASA